MRQIKYELKKRDRISTNIITDTAAAKLLMDLFCIVPHDTIKGFVQYSFSDPYGIVLTSDIQVNISILIFFNLYFNFINFLDKNLETHTGIKPNMEH